MGGVNSNQSVTKESVPNTFVVAAIDIGTTYSGYAFSFKHTFKNDPTRVFSTLWKSRIFNLVSNKTPTSILFDCNDEPYAFGYDAEENYAEILENKPDEAPGWSLFRRFKMTLYNNVQISKDFFLESTNGNTLPALTVFASSIKFLIDAMLENCDRRDPEITMDDISWVLTVPAIWSDPAKAFMRLAAEKAGISRDKLSLALEPEAAALYIRHVTLDHKTCYIEAGVKYMVIDAGGGTVDIVVHELTRDGKVREIYMANGGDWGGTKVDEAFEEYLAELVSPVTTGETIQDVVEGEEVLKLFRKSFPLDDMELKRDFEFKKRGIDSSMKSKDGNESSKVVIRISDNLFNTFAERNPKTQMNLLDNSKFSSHVAYKRGKMHIDKSVACSFFNKPLDNIVKHLKHIFAQPEVVGTDRILMVGGFSECPLLILAVRNEFPDKKVVSSDVDAGLAVLKGAVIFGHDPEVRVFERRSQVTYGMRCERPFNKYIHPQKYKHVDQDGMEWCYNLFDIHVVVGKAMSTDEPQSIRTYYPSKLVSDGIFNFSVFGTKADKPMFVTDTGVHKAGQVILKIHPKDLDYNSEIKVSLTFSKIEIIADVEYSKTGQKERNYIGYLEVSSTQ